MAVVDRTILEAAPTTLRASAPPATRKPPRTGALLAVELAAPTLVAVLLSAAYVIVSPPSLDLAAHLFRAQLFSHEGFATWNNYWYSGHNVLSYSALFPAVSALLTPQLAGALASALTALPFTVLARRHLGRSALAGTLLFGAFTATDLLTGRLPFAFGLLPAAFAVVALDLGWWWLAAPLALLSTLGSPVAGLFAALVALGYAVADLQRIHRLRAALPGLAVAASAVAPAVALSATFPEGGSEPFGLSTMLPVLAIVLLGLWATAGRRGTLRACLGVYALAVVFAYVVRTPVGSNIDRMGTLLAAPLAVTLLWGRRPRLLALAIGPLLYIGWQAPIRDLVSPSGNASVQTSYYRPLLRYLESRPGPRFRIEIPFTRFHWEADVIASHIPIARGWERQLDVHDNPIFYRHGLLNAASYRRWLHVNAIRYVAVPDAELDYSGRAEAALVDSGLPYLRLVDRTAHWRVYSVLHAVPIVEGATLTGMGGDWLRIDAPRARTLVVHVHFSPYWALTQGSGCVAPDGTGLRVTLTRPGPIRLGTRFSLGRIGAHSPRCT